MSFILKFHFRFTKTFRNKKVTDFRDLFTLDILSVHLL